MTTTIEQITVIDGMTITQITNITYICDGCTCPTCYLLAVALVGVALLGWIRR